MNELDMGNPEARIVLRDTGYSQDDTVKDLVYELKGKLEGANETEIVLPDTYDNLTHNPNQLKEISMFAANELTDILEMNRKQTNDMSIA